MNAHLQGVPLRSLLDGIAAPDVAAAGLDVCVDDLTLDSREVRRGSLFVALDGRRAHGLQFAGEAAARGAGVVLWDPAGSGGCETALSGLPDGVVSVPVKGLRGVLGRIADRYFGSPSSHLRIVGITGTNGKTTCAYLLAQCLDRLQHAAAYMGTIGWGRIEGRRAPTGGDAHTTADVITVHRRLAQLRAAGVRDLAMEVSSHALDQGRVDAVRFHTAAFTNLTRDHLDYHGTLEAYGAAKARLFEVAGLEHRVVNVGDAFGRELAGRGGPAGHDADPAGHGRVPLTAVWVGAGSWDQPADRTLCARQIVLAFAGMSMMLGGSFGERWVATKLLGRFNAENALVVLGCLLALGTPLDAAAAALADCAAPPGRLEVIAGGGAAKPLAVIDYAHTPDALAKALGALREHCRGALWCVFGCGGDRDPGKRRMMGAVADQLADRIIVTDDNPRSENPADIVREIVAGIAAHPVRIIHDRGAAISAALDEAVADDLVLIAGKGHEEYQIYGTGRRAFSDREAARRCLGVAA